MTPTVELDASHTSSKGKVQSGALKIGGEIKCAFNSSNACLQRLSKTKSTSFCNSLDNGRAILLKSFMNRR